MNEEEVELSEKINGEVRLSLKDYTSLVSAYVKADKRQKVYEDATQAVGTFLSFMRQEKPEEFSELVEKFNENSTKLKIYIDENGKPRMGLKND